MRRLQGLLLLVAAASAAACMPFGLDRSRARVTEVESSWRLESGGTMVVRTEYDYRADGRIDEITTTVDGDFAERWELSYGDDNRVEELAIISDAETISADFEYRGDLLTEARQTYEKAGTERRWDLSYHNDDPRFVDGIVVTVDLGDHLKELATELQYDERSRLEKMITTEYSEGPSGDSTELEMSRKLRYDADSGVLDRVTTTRESLTFPTVAADTCWDSGYYGDGICDSFCAQPDPDCGGGVQPVPPSSEPEIRTHTTLYSMKYGDARQLEEMNGPDGEEVEISYDDQGRIEEIESRGGSASFTIEYRYEDGSVTGHSFSPAISAGELFDVAGASFSTLALEGPLQLLQSPFGTAITTGAGSAL